MGFAAAGREPTAPLAERGPTAPFADHEEALVRLWERLAVGARDRRSPWHTPVVASSVGGEARARVVVLRAADAATRRLRFHTDARAAKAGELRDHPRVELLFYDPGANLQLRARGDARVETAGPEPDAAWAATRMLGRRCYLAPEPPGTAVRQPLSGLPADLENREPSPSESEAGRGNFAVVLVALDRLEWLHLAHGGHRRGVLAWNGSAWSGQWLLP